ncbi:MAG: hypothetical protein NZ936_11880 [Alphaproteobacteria bacterium]|nr:hypothetical protein [Alphaproteobacteria bacterium]
MDDLDLALNAKITLGISLIAYYADGRLMDEINVRTKFSRNSNRLSVSAGIIVKKKHFRISHD